MVCVRTSTYLLQMRKFGQHESRLSLVLMKDTPFMIILTIPDCFAEKGSTRERKSPTCFVLILAFDPDRFGSSGMSGPTTTTTTMGVLLERSEVDKSLRALEAVIAVFYDYCQLSASIAATSRKLARALKDIAVIKATSQYPGIIILIILTPLVCSHSANGLQQTPSQLQPSSSMLWERSTSNSQRQ